MFHSVTYEINSVEQNPVEKLTVSELVKEFAAYPAAN